jgi:hypothetical protein
VVGYLEKLKMKKRPPQVLPKLPKGKNAHTNDTAKTVKRAFDSKDSTEGWHISEISKMSKCLHGLPCRFIFVKDQRQMCSRNQQSIFDLDACPIGKWFKVKHTGDSNERA